MDKYSKIIISLMAAIFLLGSGTFVFAHRDKGYGHQGTKHHGQERHHRGYGGPGKGMFGDLSEEQSRKLDEEHTVFREATKDLRQQIYQKKLELASELARKKPDAAVAAALQQEISDFLAQLAQRRLEHFLRVQKINPDVGRGGPMGFGMMGHQMMHHDMMGPGLIHRGMMGRGGYVGRDCPWSSYRGGYGMGPGMMNRDDSRQYHDTRIVPAEKKAGAGEEN